MNKNTYLNVLVTVILIVMAVLCFVFVSALDQLRFAMEDMNRSMKNIESRLAGLRVVSGNQPAAANGTGADVANRQKCKLFFHAITSFRFCHASSRQTFANCRPPMRSSSSTFSQSDAVVSFCSSFAISSFAKARTP